MTEKSDEQVLCEAMGWCWHTWVPAFPYDDITDYTWRGHKCSKCDEYWPTKPDGDGPVVKINFTSPDILWRVLQYMMGREDYNEFDKSIWYKYHNEVINWRDGDKPSDYLKWLFSDPARFIGLANEWCREHGGGE